MVREDRRGIVKELIISIVFMTIVFLLLYGRFIFGQDMYAYTDVGSDTVSSYLPSYVAELQQLKTGFSGVFSLSRGLGKYMFSPTYKYLNPVNWPFLIAGANHLAGALMVSLFLKYLITNIFSHLFFRRLFSSGRIATMCSLLWTFCGYNVLWGQHYQFMSSMTAFTVFMWALLLFLDGDKKRILLIPAIAYLALNGYFFLFMGGLFAVIFSIIYSSFKGKGFRATAMYVIKLAGCALFGIAIAAEPILCGISDFLSSTRMSSVTSSAGLSVFYPFEVLVTFAGRFFSNDLFGSGSRYTGQLNYYEAAALSVSLLGIFSFVVLLQSRYRKRVVAMVIGAAVALGMPIISKILSTRASTQRWSFMLCIAEVIMIGAAFRFLGEEENRESRHRMVSRGMVITDIITVGGICLLGAISRHLLMEMDPNATNAILITLLAYNSIGTIYLVLNSFDKERRAGGARTIRALLIAVICVEMVLVNYPSVNNRSVVSVSEWDGSMYFDKANSAVRSISKKENDLYRVGKYALSVSLNDPVMQGFAGTSGYGSTNPRELIELYTSFGYATKNTETKTGSNWIRFNNFNVVENGLFSVKYLLTRKNDIVDSEQYELIEGRDSIRTYKSTIVDGWGYMYYDEISEGYFRSLPRAEKLATRLVSYYETGGADETDSEQIKSATDEMVHRFDFLDKMTYWRECEVELDGNVLDVHGIGDDMRLFFEFPRDVDSTLSFLRVKMTASEESSLRIYFANDNDDFSEGRVVVADVHEGEGTYEFEISGYAGFRYFRIDPSAHMQDVKIEEISIECLDTERVRNHLKSLYVNNGKGFRQDGNSLKGIVKNTEPREGVFCLPVVYNKHWHAFVDGSAVQVNNINGGLMGIRVDPGEHEVAFDYIDNTQTIGRCVGLSFLVLFLIVVLVRSRVVKKQKCE